MIIIYFIKYILIEINYFFNRREGVMYATKENSEGEIVRLGRVEARHHFIEAPGAVIPIRWHYVAAGNPNNQTILLLHGNPESWAAWQEQIEALAVHYHVIAPDLKGYGQGDKKPGDWRWENCAEEMLAFLKQIGIVKPIVVAHDRGCVLADYMLGSHPEFAIAYLRMQQVCHILNTVNSPQGVYFADPILGPSLFGDPDYYFRFRLLPMLKNPVPAEKLELIKSEMGYAGMPQAVIRYFQSSSFEKERLDRTTRLLRNMSFPVLLLQGRLDNGQPPYYFEDLDSPAVNCFPNAKLKWLAAGHYLGLEKPAQVTAIIAEFAQQVSEQ
uniref:AB hydrolase-1 domain-containing protein n=1 Tax=OCS116 cluster bacterium TaxID=2030921 RepID=A0A2A4Z0N4_9PROT